MDQNEFQNSRPTVSTINELETMVDDNSKIKSPPSLMKKKRTKRSSSLTLSTKKLIKKFVPRVSLPSIDNHGMIRMIIKPNHSSQSLKMPNDNEDIFMLTKKSKKHRKLGVLKSVNMDVDIQEHRFKNVCDDYYDTINSSKIQVNILNEAYNKLSELQNRFKFDEQNRENQSPDNPNISSKDDDFDLELDFDKFLAQNHRMFVTSIEAKQYEYLCNRLHDETIDDENIKCVTHRLQRLWQCRQTSRLIFFYEMFSFMFKRYLQFNTCTHQKPCPSSVNVSRFQRFAIPILQEFTKIIDPNKSMILQIELLAAIESLVCHKQEYLIAVADVFDLLLKSPLIEPCAFPKWSRLEDPNIYFCNDKQHQKVIKSKSNISIKNDQKEKQQQQQDTIPTIRDLIIKQLENNGIPLSKKNRNSIS